jgi:hypothetical protein
MGKNWRCVMKTMLLAGLVLMAGGLTGFGQSTATVTNGPAIKHAAAKTHPQTVPPKKNVKPQVAPTPRGGDFYRYTQTDPALLAHYSQVVADSEQAAKLSKADRMSWINTESIFRPGSEEIGDNSVRDTVITIFPPGR